MPDSDLLKLTISEVAPLIQAREVSPVDLTEAALNEAADHVNQVFDRYNAQVGRWAAMRGERL